MPDQSDRELFLKEVSGIERLKQDRVPAGRRKAGDRESLARKRQAAEQGSERKPRPGQNSSTLHGQQGGSSAEGAEKKSRRRRRRGGRGKGGSGSGAPASE